MLKGLPLIISEDVLLPTAHIKLLESFSEYVIMQTKKDGKH